MSRKGKSKFRIVGRKEASCKKNAFRLSKTSLVGYSSLGMLGLLTLAMLLPVSSTETHAESSTTREQRVNLNVQPVVSVAMDPAIEVDITPKAGGSTSSSTTEFKVSTNSDTGFKVYLKSGSASSNSLVNYNVGEAASTKEILATSKATTLSQFEANTWGYAVMEADTELSDSTVYQAVPKTVDNAIVETDKTNVNLVSGNSYKLAFGAKVDTSLPAGVYTNTVVVSAVANPIEVTSLSQLTYMQQMTSEICANTPSAMNDPSGASGSASGYYLNPVTKRLIDTRDGNFYWVAKLADGNCWMTQNLALNLGERPVDAPASYSRYVKTLTPGDSDVVSEWTVPINYTTYRTNPDDPTVTTTEEIRGTEVGVPHKETNKDGGSPDAITLSGGTRSWNLGKLVQINPTNSFACKQETVPENLAALGYVTEHNASLWYGQAPIANYCTRYQSVDDLIPSNKVIATKDSSIIGNEYDAHYLLGNYYQWSTATAQTELITTEIDKTTIYDASGSICPKGWRLPATGVQMTEPIQILNRDKSPYQLLYAYGYPSYDSIGTDMVVNWKPYVGSLYTNLVGGSRTRIDFIPTYFMHTGTLSPLAGNIVDFGGSGFYRTSTLTSSSQDKTGSAYFDVNPYSTYPAASRNKALGIAIRCLAR